MAPFAFVFLACLLPSWVSAKAVPSYELYDYDPVANTVRSMYYNRNGDRGDAADNDDDIMTIVMMMMMMMDFF